MKKKLLAGLLLAAMALSACSSSAEETTAAATEAAAEATEAAEEAADTEAAAESGDESGWRNPSSETPLLGLTCQQYSDTHIANVRNAIMAANDAKGWFKLETTDSQNDIGTEWNNIQALITKGAEYLIAGYLNYENYPQLIEACKEADIAFVTYNCNAPSDEEVESYDKFYFVSSAAEASGRIQGEAAAEYWKEHPEADRNGNGKMDYVMLQGTLGFYDTEMRTKYSIEAVENAGIEVNELISVACEFQRAKAQDQMASVIAAHADDIDVVFANNDDMALGAIEALKAAGFFTGDESTYIPVLGVDATAPGCQALKDGTLLATSLNNPVVMGNVCYQVIEWMREGKEITQEMLDEAGFDTATIDDHHRIWLDYVPITAENADEANIEALTEIYGVK